MLCLSNQAVFALLQRSAFWDDIVDFLFDRGGPGIVLIIFIVGFCVGAVSMLVLVSVFRQKAPDNTIRAGRDLSITERQSNQATVGIKRCPSCNSTYTDDALSYCLRDGTPLKLVGSMPVSSKPNLEKSS